MGLTSRGEEGRRWRVPGTLSIPPWRRSERQTLRRDRETRRVVRLRPGYEVSAREERRILYSWWHPDRGACWTQEIWRRWVSHPAAILSRGRSEQIHHYRTTAWEVGYHILVDGGQVEDHEGGLQQRKKHGGYLDPKLWREAAALFLSFVHFLG